jgi:hypothetical protein
LELRIGITDNNPQWTLVLNQIGVLFDVLDSESQISSSRYQVIVVCSNYGKTQKVRDFLNTGISIITEANIAREIFEISTKKVTIKYLLPENSPPFDHIPICDLKIRSEVAVGSSHLKNQNGIETVSIQKHEHGQLMILPTGLMDALKSHQIKRKNFPPVNGKDYPSERVSLISKGAIRQIIEKAIKYLFHEKELPFLHLWNFPEGRTGIFCFRIDTDFASKDDVTNLYELCKKCKIPATWFVETRTKESWMDFFHSFENQEIGYHCYRHRIFKDHDSNYNDFKLGLSILKKANIKPAGYASPYGEWSPILSEVIQSFGFEYSSEFGLSYDNLPFQPIANQSISPVYQIPIHPLSIRKLIITHHSEEQILQYYLRTVEEKLIFGEPVIFYHHPSHKSINIFQKLFEKISEKDIAVLTMGDYSSWWKRRNEFDWEAHYFSQQPQIKSKLIDKSIWIKIDYPDGQEILQPINPDGQSAKKLCLNTNEKIFDYNPKELRKLNLKMLFNDLLSVYGKMRQ